MKYIFKILFAVFLLAIAPASAQTLSPVTVENAYAFATAPGQKSGAAFMTIHNSASTPDRLIAASAPDVADKAEFHNSFIEDGMMMMVKKDSYEVPANGTLTLESAGGHIMLLGLHGALAAGQTFPIKLTFEKNGEVSVNVVVQPPGEPEADPDMPDMPEMHHQ